MITIRVYWDDLNDSMQKKLLAVFGENCNWDCIPISVIEINNSGKDIVIDSFLGDEGLE